MQASMIAVAFSALVLVAGCATQRYGRLTPVSGAESQVMTCHDVQVEMAKANGFLSTVHDQRSQMNGAQALGILGDFGIGNAMEGQAAEDSGMQRIAQLRWLDVQKGCARTSG
jgi:enoyl-CoA hydratase/carnithine racemase